MIILGTLHLKMVVVAEEVLVTLIFLVNSQIYLKIFSVILAEAGGEGENQILEVLI